MWRGLLCNFCVVAGGDQTHAETQRRRGLWGKNHERLGEGDGKAPEQFAQSEKRFPGLCVVTGSVGMGRICFWSGQTPTSVKGMSLES